MQSDAHKKPINKKGGRGGSNTNVVNRRGCRRPFVKALERFPRVKEKKVRPDRGLGPEDRGTDLDEAHRRVGTGGSLARFSMEFQLIYFPLHWPGLRRASDPADLLPPCSFKAPGFNHRSYFFGSVHRSKCQSGRGKHKKLSALPSFVYPQIGPAKGIHASSLCVSLPLYLLFKTSHRP